eukprot:m.28623 g.28623  ORF g.28623 m.28623 type:complete len:594 (-) comp8017_c0_seq1:1666-3447(-)
MSSNSKHPAELVEHFKFEEKIGEGGFARVRLGRHKLTGEKVAIKIMEKAALMKTNDLPRVAREIDALKSIRHQNIAQLFYVYENATHFYLVLEYAPGGELFDYIVARQRCREEEARRFFRQIACAVAYCHKLGIAHRDLKPENLLLDKQMNIKLIDFGLIARPGNLHNDLLTTCCGSAAYAAPELIRGEKYLGEPADMWSLGILLYALLVGWLPFDDDNMQTLYKLIQKGSYDIPPFLSQESVKLISELLRHRPEKRLTMDQLLRHPWLLKGTKLSHIDPESVLEGHANLDRHVVTELAKYYSMDIPSMEGKILEWKYDMLTCNYFLLLKKRKAGEMVRLPQGKSNMSPDVAMAFIRSKGAPSKASFSADSGGPISQKETANLILSKGYAGKRQSKRELFEETPASAAMTLPPIKPITSDQRSASVGHGDLDLSKLGISKGQQSRKSNLINVNKEADVYHSAAAGLDNAGLEKPKRGSIRTLLGSVANMFGSREQLEPRKIKGLFNVSTTSSKDPAEVMEEVQNVLKANEYECKTKGFLIKARKTGGAKPVYINFEICVAANVNLTGIRLTRIKGDTWEYKKETEALLKQMHL